MESNFSVYLRFTAYDSTVLTATGVNTNEIVVINDTDSKFDAQNQQFIPVQSCFSDVEQTLNIGSQSTGAGAGKIVFNPFIISRKTDAISPSLFERSASGTPFKTIEVFYVDDSQILQFKQTYKLAAVKTISWSVNADSTGVSENVTFEYGGLVIAVFQKNTEGEIEVFRTGWNRVKNVRDNDESVEIR